MIFPYPVSVTELADKLQATLIGDAGLLATGINELHNSGPGDIIYVDVSKYFEKALNSKASVILVNEATDCPTGKCLLVVPDPFAAYNAIVWEFRPLQPIVQSVSASASIGEGTIVEPGAVIGPNAIIGRDAYIHANAYIGEGVRLGDRVVVQPCAVVGSDAFYFKKTPTGFVKWRSGGTVVIEDDVEIGANCTVNRGVSSDTFIGQGTKLDCLVQIGHDVKIGRHCLLAAQTGVAGNSVLEDGVILYGQVGIAQNLRIGAGAVVLAKSGVSKSLEGGKTYFGYPAQEAKEAYRELAALRHLPDIWRRFSQ
jgi:UDP-3-O-[3-hydroxymyristoyl] glucosamine N-acyltransferase